MNYTVKESGTIHGFCPPGYERVASYSKKDGTIVHGHCRRMNTPLTKDEIHAMYSPSEWKEVERNNREWRSSNMAEKRRRR